MKNFNSILINEMIHFIRKAALEGSEEALDLTCRIAVEKANQQDRVGPFLVPSDAAANIRELIRADQKIAAIKALRTALQIKNSEGEFSTIGLREAKEAIEDYTISIKPQI